MMMDDDKDPTVDGGTEETPVTNAAPEASEETVEASAPTEQVAEDEEEAQPAVKVIRKEASRVEVVLAEEVKEEGVEIEEEDLSGATGSAHDDFNWNMRARSAASRYSADERTSLEQEYEASMTNIAEAEIMSAKVSSIIDGDVILDLNYKSDGLLPLSEFRDQDLKVGDTVEVYVEQQEDERGQLVLSRRKAKLLRAWDRIRDSYANGTVINGRVISKTKGGLIADCGGLETFLPGSQIDIKPIVDYDAYVGKTMEFKVVKINETIKNAVVSHKALIESDLAEQREAIIASLERGQVLEGIVKNITDFGAFLDLGGVDGLLYITDISWGRINHPSDVLDLNQKVNVAVLDFDENKKRISLGLKQLLPHPWEVLDETITEGSTVEGKVVNIEDYGAFLEIQPGVEGLVHVSEVSWSNQPINAREYFTVGEMKKARVVTIDRDDRKMSLSIKQLASDPWERINSGFGVGSNHTGKVKNLTPYGVFVELDEGIGGMIHISDLSWTKRFSHPSEFTKVGEKIDVVVLEVDEENRKMSLGHKQLEENPWESFESVFPEGSYHEATVLRKDDRGAIVQMPYGLEAYGPIKLMRKEDGSIAEVDETLTVKVIEFDRESKRLTVSHSRYVNDIRREAKDQVSKERQEERETIRKAIQKTSASNEPSTLGDLSAFGLLREQLSNNDEDGE
ncbi:30S ribosomal protein S1 [Neolewinella lacunae]|uniref:Small ribosomal subunit protein bS1 n=1 Tax=Neolewinella lacunae TaxID=1517758 RepID=A0A923PEL8_9BACT|nr:30S ribosomal protein S1 [Neolewinella lacunae]MBC6992693.1 30S ribosomal protein S1 [Neolewinella lacunae]MDN3633573.1 30S ribosomal protein S1 [Neolewinella lacunae]